MARIKQFINDLENPDELSNNLSDSNNPVNNESRGEIELLKNELQKLKQENLKLKNSIENEKKYDEVISSLQAQISALSNKLLLNEIKETGNKVIYRPVRPEDWEEDTAVFTASKFMFIVGGYEKNGVIYNPPHKLIKFTYAASDVRKDGREDKIKHYCQFETNLKTEKEFLRNHPLYNVMFFENLNNTMATETELLEYSANAATEVASLGDSEVISKLHSLGIKATNKYSINELRGILIKHLAEKYQAMAKEQLTVRTQRMLQNMITATMPKENDTGE